MIEPVEYETVWHGSVWRDFAPEPVELIPELPISTKAIGLICEHSILDALKHGYRTRAMLVSVLRKHSVSSVTAALTRLKRRKAIARRTVYLASRERMGIVWGLAGAPPPVGGRPVITQKVCRLCEQMKPLDEYGICESRHDKRATGCKVCVGAYNREYKQRRRLATHTEAA